MKIFTNQSYEIIALDNAPEEYAYVFEIAESREEAFGTLCDTVILGYKFEPQYKLIFNEDGSNARDEKTGEILYELDNEGNKIENGFSCTPFISYQTLMLIQMQYEDSQKQVQALNARIAYLSMMSGYEMEV